MVADAVAKWQTGERFIELGGLPGAKAANGWAELLAVSAQTLKPRGMLLEFGVASGSTTNWISSQTPQRRWYGFDTFEGLPTPWHKHPQGQFSQQGILPKVDDNVQLITGLFEDTLPPFIDYHREELEREGIAMLHIDCDLYSSTKTVFNSLSPFCVRVQSFSSMNIGITALGSMTKLKPFTSFSRKLV